MNKFAWLLVAGVAAGGCGSSADTSALDAYRMEFLNDNPHVARAVPRGPYMLGAREFRATQEEDGPPIVMMHGYPDSQMLYDRLVGHLRSTRQVVTFDFLGWGDSDKPADHRYDAASLRDDLEAVIAHFGWDEVVIVVHDASGWPGIDWALDNPTRVAGLVLLNTVYGPTDGAQAVVPEGLEQFSPFNENYAAEAVTALEDLEFWQTGLADQLKKFFSMPAPRDEYVPLFVEQSPDMRPAFLDLASRLVDEIFARADDEARGSEFARPVRVVFGADDPYLNLEVAGAFASRFPTAVRTDIADASHYVQMDQPERVATEILATHD